MQTETRLWNTLETFFRTLSFHLFLKIKHVFIQITQVRAHYFKLFNRVKSTQDEKARFIKRIELKLTQSKHSS